MKLLNQITMKRSVFEPDFRGPRLVGRKNAMPVIRTSDFDPDILVFQTDSWQLCTSCHRDSSDMIWGIEPSPHGLLLSKCKLGTPHNYDIQNIFLDPQSGQPFSPSFSGLFVWEYLSNGTLLCVEEYTHEFVCTTATGNVLWRSSIFRHENIWVQCDKNYLYFQEENVIHIYTLQGQKIGAFPSPADLAPRNFWVSYLSFDGGILRVEGINRSENYYMTWDCFNGGIRSQILSDLSSLPDIYRISRQEDNILFIASSSSESGDDTQCFLIRRNAPTAPTPLFSYREREFSGGEICWLDNETFIFLKHGLRHSSFCIYSIRGERLSEEIDLPGFLWMDAFFFSGGLFYIQTHSSLAKKDQVLYHFTVYQL